MSEHQAKYQIGEVVHHNLFGYLGLIFDVDPTFNGTDEWYEQVARSRPPKDEPWHHVLVDQADHTTYVAEQNLQTSAEPQAIRHRLTEHFFDHFDGERYSLRDRMN